uniref:JHL25H03.7 protein n=1 Tax=Jatropha curcas TaxID=180498 RepID=E6NUD5_JATCU|nr:JHL25H03.7 [Jatropha curcas]
MLSMDNNFQVLNADVVKGIKSGESSSSTPRIQKAPSVLHDIQYFHQHLEPKVYSFGPIHHGRYNLRRGEEMKQKLAAQFISDYELDASSKYDKILKQIRNFRDCYDKDVTEKCDDQQLSRIFYVDGCALLFYVICCTSDDLYRLRTLNITAILSHNDLFLLENQLPYGLLEILMEGAQTGKGLSLLMDEFVRSQNMVPGKPIETEVVEGEWKPDHLLELLWMKVRFPKWNWSTEMLQRPKRNNKKMSTHSQEVTVLASSSPSYTVNKLIESGILLKPSDQSTSLTDISLRGRGIFKLLKLRPLIIDESTVVKLSNLVAYEMCPGLKHELEVISFVCFVNSLIADVENVGKLISKGILVNLLSKHEEVFNIFREMAKNLIPNPHIYNDVRWDIQNYLDSQKSFQFWLKKPIRAFIEAPVPWARFLLSFLTINFTVAQTVLAAN